MATARKSNYVFVVPTRFYPPRVLAEKLNVNEKLLLKNAVIAGALYQINCKKLIKWDRMDKFLNEVGGFLDEKEEKYCLISEAIKRTGIPEKNIMQFASDAEALLKIDNMILIHLESLEKYVNRCKYVVNLIDGTEENENRNRRRRTQL